MLKIVVFDSGFGGELFADQLQTEVPIVEVIRVIDWRNAEKMTRSPYQARKIAEKALKPYLGKADLIILANYLLSVTSLKYFQRKYKNQRFLGLTLRTKRTVRKPTLILTTKAVSRTFAFFKFSKSLRAKTICLDAWPALIDDGQLTDADINQKLEPILYHRRSFAPQQILLACGQFADLKPQFRALFGRNARIIDGFDHAINETCRLLKLRGSIKKHKT